MYPSPKHEAVGNSHGKEIDTALGDAMTPAATIHCVRRLQIHEPGPAQLLQLALPLAMEPCQATLARVGQSPMGLSKGLTNRLKSLA